MRNESIKSATLTLDKLNEIQVNRQLEVPIQLAEGSSQPVYATEDAAGADLKAYIEEEISLSPGETVSVPTGVSVALPKGFEMQIRPRSGLAKKYGVTVLNSPGTIDADYRGEIIVLLVNHGHSTFIIKPNDRIAQAVIAPVFQVNFVKVDALDETERGAGGFGHTGVHSL